MSICMVGAGYVELVPGFCFADFGHNVVCIDKDTNKIEGPQSGNVPIYEPGLEALISKNVKSGRLTFTKDLAYAVKKGC